MHGNVKLSRLFDPYHDCGEDLNTWLSVAKYLTKERPEDGPDVTPNGAQLYSCSRNLKKPIVISEWVEDADRVEIPSTACGVEYSESHTEYSTFRYYKYMIVPLKGAK